MLLITGFWMAANYWSLALFWVRAALIIVAIVLVLMYAVVGPSRGRLAQVVETEGLASPKRQRPERISLLVGGGSSLLIIVVIWLMVAKPS